jgi:hypothetical protein
MVKKFVSYISYLAVLVAGYFVSRIILPYANITNGILGVYILYLLYRLYFSKTKLESSPFYGFPRNVKEFIGMLILSIVGFLIVEQVFGLVLWLFEIIREIL